MKKTTTKKSALSATATTATATKTAVTTPKPVAAAPSPVKSAMPVKAVPTKSTVPSAASPITIEATIDVGFGNNLYVRGEGAGLSWDRGIPLECVDSRTWRLIVPAKDKLLFKLLLNDTVWAQGDDVVATPGKKVEVSPAF